MPTPAADWSTHQLAEFLAAVSTYTEEASAMRGAIERAAEAFEAEVAAVVRDRTVVAVVGFPQNRVPEQALVALSSSTHSRAEIPGIGQCAVAVGDLEESQAGRLVLARVDSSEFSVEERNLVRGMARVLGLTLGMLERQRLLERLSKIQRSISHRAPLQEVLDSVTTGAAELLGADVVGIRLLDPDDPAYALVASTAGVEREVLEKIRRTPVTEGVGGRAIVDDRIVLIEDYENEPGMVPSFAARHLKTAMAAPVHENGVVAGSLVVASYRLGRKFSQGEQDALLALAEHASLALTDSKTVDAMREAQLSKDMFLAMVSHELKTPLTVIMGALRTLEVHGDNLPESIRAELLTSGWERGKELERLINRLLQGARAELAGGEEDVLIEEVIHEAVRGFEHSRRIVVDTPPGVTVRIDRQAVQEIVGILLENAVSHSAPDSHVRIEASVAGTNLTIAVANAGVLPEELDPATLFQPFLRGAEVTSPGVGLGLYIAGRVADTLGGAIEVEAENSLVRFIVRIPVIEVGSAPNGWHAATGSPRADTPAR